MPKRSDPSRVTHMNELLEQELATSQQLKQLLMIEHKVVTSRNIPAFEEILGEKQSILDHLAIHEQTRLQLLESQGIDHTAKGMDNYINSSPDAERLSRLWQQLLSVAADCRDQNRLNHQLVELCSAHTRKALCVLRGEPVEQQLYGPDGDKSDPHGNRSIAIA